MPRELKQWLPDEVRARLGLTDEELIGAQLAARSVEGAMIDTRALTVEARANEDGTTGLFGYATSWDTWYDVAGGPPYGWRETIVRGAANKSLIESGFDVRFLINHEGLALARTRNAAFDTMKLAADDLGLAVDFPSPDVLRNPRAAELVSSIDRRDTDQMSFAFMALRQEWNADYTERRIIELKLFDVSAVTYPANTATIIGARSAQPSTVEPTGYPLGLALAQAAALG